MSYLKYLIRDKSILFNKSIPILNNYISKLEIKNEIKNKIIAVGDVHGSFLQFLIPLIITNFIKNVEITDNEIKFDFNDNSENTNKIIYLGDIFDRAYHNKYYLIVNALIKLIYKYPNNIIWCYGNHDVDEYYSLLLKIKNKMNEALQLQENFVRPGRLLQQQIYSSDLNDDEQQFYNFSLANLRTIYYEPSINAVFSHTLILDKVYKSILTGDMEDLILFSSEYSLDKNEISKSMNSHDSCSEDIEEFNNNVRFLINQKSIAERIICKCFNNRYEDIEGRADLSPSDLEDKIFMNDENIIHVVGHDIVNTDEFILENSEAKIIFTDFAAMYKKGSFNPYYIERPKFVIFNEKPEILSFDKLTIKL